MALEPIDSRKQIKKVLNNAEIFKENGSDIMRHVKIHLITKRYNVKIFQLSVLHFTLPVFICFLITS